MEAWLIKVLSDFTPGAVGIWVGVGWLIIQGVGKWLENRKLTVEERQANREGFTQEVTNLRSENRSLLDDQRLLRREYDDHRRQCQIETDQLREHIVSLENRMAGMMRKVADIAVRAARGEIDANMAASILALAAEAGPKTTGKDNA